MIIRPAEEGDLSAWVKLQHSLWPHHTLEELETDSREVLSNANEICFLLIDPSAGGAVLLSAESILLNRSPMPVLRVGMLNLYTADKGGAVSSSRQSNDGVSIKQFQGSLPIRILTIR